MELFVDTHLNVNLQLKYQKIVNKKIDSIKVLSIFLILCNFNFFTILFFISFLFYIKLLFCKN